MYRTGLVLAVVSLLMACGSTSPAAPAQPYAGGTVVVLGDSLAVSPNRAQSFPAVLQTRFLDEGQPWRVINAGVSGDTTGGGVRRVETALAGGGDILVLALGANDGLRGVPVETIERNLGAIIERAQARGMRVLLCGMETPPAHGWAYTVAFHEVYPRLARQYGVPLVPFLLAGVALVPDMNGPDGFHPNAAGARRIADTIWPYLEPMLRTAAAA